MSNQFPTDPSQEDLRATRRIDRSVAVIEPEDALMESEDVVVAVPAESTGPCCENCGAPAKAGSVTICRSCGWYASLGRCVEVDGDWAAEDADKAANEQADVTVQVSHLRVWLKLLPGWAWLIIASVLAVIVESVVVRIVTPAEIGGLRTKWSLIQLALGIATFASCHFANYMIQIMDDSEVGLMDFVLKPVRLWMQTFHLLPSRFWLVNGAACGLTAAVMSILVIGALPYDRLWDWGFKAPVKHTLMGAVMDRARKVEAREQSLEEAINDFAGKAGVEEEMAKAKPPERREKADCVILGYELDRDGRLEYLVLATSHLKRLVFAGKVNPQISETERRELLAELTRIQIREPFIPLASDSAKWVQAKIACRVTYTEKMRGGQLRDIQWDMLLGSMRRPDNK